MDEREVEGDAAHDRGDATDAWLQVCASEFRGREFACRPLPAVVGLVRSHGIGPAEIFAGLGYSHAHLLDVSQRIDWMSALMVGKNLSRTLSDAQLIQLGSDALRSRSLRFLTVIARFLMQPAEYYRFAARELARYCTCMGAYVRQVTPSEVHMHVLMEPGYPPMRELFLTLQGALMSMTEVYGRRSADVRLEETPRGALYRIELPGVGGLTGTLRRAFGWSSTMRAAARDLREANELLHRRDAALLRKEAELAEVERRYRALLESSLDCVFMIDAAGKICIANRRSETAFGATPTELLGRYPTELVELSPLRLREFLSLLRREGFAHVEALARKLDGSVFPVETFCCALEDGRVQVVLVDLRERKRIEYEKSRQARELDARVAARTEELERVNEELRRQQLRMVQAERVRALEQVASKLSAALNPAVAKLIQTLEGAASMEALADGGVAQGMALAHEISTVVATTLSQISVDGAAGRTRESVTELLADAIQLISAEAESRSIRIESIIPAGLSAVRVDRGLFVGALAALGANGLDAMDAGDTLSFRVEEQSGGARLILRVIDEGRGIPRELFERVLDPHFTTKPGRAGLGLPLALGVVQGHGGRLELISPVCERGGTEVRIDLPLEFGRALARLA